MPARPLALGLRGPNRVAIGRVRRMVAALRRIGGSLWMVDNAFIGSYIDISGSQPVTAYADLLGLTTDRLGVVGPNLVSDASAALVGEAVRVSAGVYRIYSSAGTLASIDWNGSLVVGKTYLAEFTIDSITTLGAGVSVDQNGVALATYTTTGRKTCVFTATIANARIKRQSGATDIQISAVVTRELTGNHATQSAVASKPSVQRVPKRLGPNLVSNGDFSSGTAGWTAAGVGVISTASGELVVTSNGAGAAIGAQQLNLVAGSRYLATCRAVALPSSGSVQLNAQTVSSGGAITAAVSLSIGAISFEFVATASNNWIGARITGALGAGEVARFDNIAVQEVLEWSTVISFDGSNDFLQTGITTGNEGWWGVGVTLANSNTAYLLYAGANSNAEAGVVLRSISGALQLLCGDGVARDVKSDQTITVGSPKVYDGGWTASQFFTAVDGVESSMGAKTRNCAGTVPMAIGSQSGLSAFMNGSLYAGWRAPILPDAATRKIIRDGIAALQGRTL